MERRESFLAVLAAAFFIFCASCYADRTGLSPYVDNINGSSVKTEHSYYTIQLATYNNLHYLKEKIKKISNESAGRSIIDDIRIVKESGLYVAYALLVKNRSKAQERLDAYRAYFKDAYVHKLKPTYFIQLATYKNLHYLKEKIEKISNDPAGRSIINDIRIVKEGEFYVAFALLLKSTNRLREHLGIYRHFFKDAYIHNFDPTYSVQLASYKNLHYLKEKIEKTGSDPAGRSIIDNISIVKKGGYYVASVPLLVKSRREAGESLAAYRAYFKDAYIHKHEQTAVDLVEGDLAGIEKATVEEKAVSVPKEKPSVSAVSPVSRVSDAKTLSKSELFKLAFKKKKSETISIPLILDGEHIGNISVFIRDSSVEKINKNRLLAILENAVKPNVLKQIIDETKYSDSLTKEELKKYGITSEFNERDLLFYVETAPEIRAFKTSYIKRKIEIDKTGAMPPAKHSGAINFFVNQTFRNSQDETELEREPLKINADFFLNFKNYTLNGGANFIEEEADGNTSKVYRNKFYLTRYDEENGLKYMAGDMQTKQLSMASGRNIVGLSVEKKSDIFGFEKAEKTNSRELFLETDSEVEIFINDKMKKRLYLKAGNHILHDIPLDGGVSKIEIVITDKSGKVKTLEFVDFQYAELLNPSEAEFGMTAGYAYDVENNRFVYRKSRPAASVYGNYGLNENHTVKTGLQYAKGYANCGVELLGGNDFGLLNFGLLYTDSKIAGWGYKVQAGYKRKFFNELSLRASIVKKSSDFSTITTIQKDDYSSLSKTLSISSPLPWKASGQFSFTETDSADDSTKKYGINLSKSITADINTALKATNQTSRSSGEDNMLLLTLNWRPNKQPYELTYSNDLSDNERTYAARYNNDSSRYGNMVVDASYANREEEDTYSAGARDNTEWFDFSADYDESILSEENRKDKKALLRLSWGIAFADGHMALSDPIRSSFVLFDKEEELRDTAIEILNKKDAVVKTNTLLKAPNHSVVKYNFSEENLPLGKELKKYEIKILTKYKTGTYVMIETKKTYRIQGRAIAGENSPLSFNVVKIYGKEHKKIKTFFTGKDGDFLIDGMDLNSDADNFRMEFTDKRQKLTRYHDIDVTKMGADNNTLQLGDIMPMEE